MSKDPLGRGRPAAEDLRSRCVQLNRAGKRCGSPALEGSKVCKMHLGAVSERKLATTSDRLIKLTSKALDRLETIIETGADDVAERAARTILDRTVPKPGAQNALFVNVGQSDQDPTVIAGDSPADRIRKRLLQLVSSENQPATAPSLGDLEQGYANQAGPEIVDAEIVEPGPQARTA